LKFETFWFAGIKLESPEKNSFFILCTLTLRDERVPITMAWRVLRLRKEERPPIWTIVANISNKLSQKPTRFA